MPTLLLRLEGPMQSWGTESLFDLRDSDREPSKSGVLGLLCAARGIDRDNWYDLEPMVRWNMGVRIDRPGELRVEYQTAQSRPGHAKTDTAQSWRHYVADASFLVGFESEDRVLLEAAHSALKAPRWQLCLGRKSFLPSRPVYLSDGCREQGLVEALRSYPVDEKVPPVRLLVESSGEHHFERNDQPSAAFSQHRYSRRLLRVLEFQTGGS